MAEERRDRPASRRIRLPASTAAMRARDRVRFRRCLEHRMNSTANTPAAQLDGKLRMMIWSRGVVYRKGVGPLFRLQSVGLYPSGNVPTRCAGVEPCDRIAMRAPAVNAVERRAEALLGLFARGISTGSSSYPAGVAMFMWSGSVIAVADVR